MSCQHTWIKVNRAYEDYQCSQCEMSLSVDEYDAIQQAHREGWEQCQRECVEKIDSEICDCCWGEEAQEASDHLCETIAAMEYGGKAND